MVKHSIYAAFKVFGEENFMWYYFFSHLGISVWKHSILTKGRGYMLKIWYYGGVSYMADAPSYFDNVYEDEWIEDPFVKEMIQDVDSSTVLSAHIIESPILGPITPKELSGGVKVLILMLKDDSFVYNLTNCGNNCAKWVLKIAEQKDLTVYLQYMIRFEGEFEIQIMNTGKIVCNQKEYVLGLIEAERLMDER